MTHILQTVTVHKTASLADEGNSAYCKSSGAHNIKHNLWKLALRGHLNTDKQGSKSELFAHENDALPLGHSSKTLLNSIFILCPWRLI